MAAVKFRAEGIMPATLLAFRDDFSIDEGETRSHLRDVMDVEGVTAVVVNGHASEVHACTFDEQKQVIELAVDEAKGKTPIVGGVYTDSTLEAVRLAKMSEAAGCSALLVFPPNSLGFGAVNRWEMPLAYFKAIASATDRPLILFQYHVSSPLHYSRGLLEKLVEEVPSIAAIKDYSGDVPVHEHNIRTFQSLSKPVSILTTHSAWLLGSLVLGPKGILSGAGSVIPDLQSELFNAVQNDDLPTARVVYSRVQAISNAFYSAPLVDMHNRMKEALVMLGRQKKAVVRAPLLKLDDGELSRIREGLVGAGLLKA